MTCIGRACTRHPACAPLRPYGPGHCGAISPTVIRKIRYDSRLLLAILGIQNPS